MIDKRIVRISHIVFSILGAITAIHLVLKLWAPSIEIKATPDETHNVICYANLWSVSCVEKPSVYNMQDLCKYMGLPKKEKAK